MVDACIEKGKLFGVFIAKDRWGRPVLLFRNAWKLNQLTPNSENGFTVESEAEAEPESEGRSGSSSCDPDVAALGLVAWSRSPSPNSGGGRVHLGF